MAQPLQFIRTQVSDAPQASSVRSIHIARPALQNNLEPYGAFNLYADDDHLFAQGKTWEDLKIVRRDPKFVSVFGQRTSASAGSDWEIMAASDDPKDVEIAAWVKTALARLNMRDLLRQLLDGVTDGFSAAELMWDYDRDGRLVPGDIVVKPAEWFKWDEDGRLLYTPDGSSVVELPERKFITFRHLPRRNQPYGVKMAAILYWTVYIKRHARQFQAIYLEKFSIPPIVAKYAAGTDDADLTKLDLALAAWSSDMGIRIPDNIEIEIVKHVQSGKQPHDAVLAACNREITTTLLGGSLTVEAESESGRGTQALGQKHEESFMRIVADDAAGLERALDDVIRWMVDFNFGTATAAPTFDLQTEEAALDLDRNQNLRDWIDQGLPVSRQYVYDVAQVPPPAPDDELMDAATDAAADTAADTDPDKAFASSDTDAMLIAARATEAASLRTRDRFMASAVEAGQQPFGQLRTVIGLLISGSQTDPAQQAIDGVDDGHAYEAARRALNRYYVRLAHDQARGLDNKPLSAAKLKTLTTKLTKRLGAGADADTVSRWLAESPQRPALFNSLVNARLFGRLLGMQTLAEEAEAQLSEPLGLLRFAEAPGMDDWLEQPVEAIQAAKRRLNISPERWKEMTGQEKATAFSYAHAPNMGVVEDVRGLLDSSLSDGESFGVFKARLEDLYDAKGIGSLDDWYIETIFNTNTLSAYGRGRWEQQNDPALKGAFPYKRWVTAGDEAVRPEHAALEGVYPADDPVFSTHYPPLGYNCRCSVQVATEGRVKAEGWEVESGETRLAEMPESTRKSIEAATEAGFGRTDLWG